MSAFVHFVIADKVLLCSAGVALLDLLFAINPTSKANGIVHWFYLFMTDQKAPPQAPVASA